MDTARLGASRRSARHVLSSTTGLASVGVAWSISRPTAIAAAIAATMFSFSGSATVASAALAAVVAPEVVMQQGHLIGTLKDARIYATLTATAYFFWRRGILGTIVTGTLVMVALRTGLGW